MEEITENTLDMESKYQSDRALLTHCPDTSSHIVNKYFIDTKVSI